MAPLSTTANPIDAPRSAARLSTALSSCGRPELTSAGDGTSIRYVAISNRGQNFEIDSKPSIAGEHPAAPKLPHAANRTPALQKKDGRSELHGARFRGSGPERRLPSQAEHTPKLIGASKHCPVADDLGYRFELVHAFHRAGRKPGTARQEHRVSSSNSESVSDHAARRCS